MVLLLLFIRRLQYCSRPSAAAAAAVAVAVAAAAGAAGITSLRTGGMKLFSRPQNKDEKAKKNNLQMRIRRKREGRKQ